MDNPFWIFLQISRMFFEQEYPLIGVPRLDSHVSSIYIYIHIHIYYTDQSIVAGVLTSHLRNCEGPWAMTVSIETQHVE